MSRYTHIRTVTNDLVLELLPALHAALDEHLRGEGERLGREIAQFVRVVGETRAETAECKSRTQNNRVTNLLGSSEGIINRGDSRRLSNGDIDFCIKYD